jgi:metal-responsive CopG/Arc/MetJ family transcriptional regulator
MFTKPTSKKEKVTISVDADLLQVVDSFVEVSKKSGLSRSSVIERALHLWKQQVRDTFDAQYYEHNKEALADESWTAITTEAAKHIWKE